MPSIAVVSLSVVLALQVSGCLGRPSPMRKLLSGEGGFNYQDAGNDWPDAFPDCGGTHQSPINVDSEAAKDNFNEIVARIVTFGEGNNVRVRNEGQAVKVVWEQKVEATVLVPSVGGKVYAAVDPLNTMQDDEGGAPLFSFASVTLSQFHFHIPSENAIDGEVFPMEAHLVGYVSKDEVPACGDSGCLVVFGTLFRVSEDPNVFIERILQAIPEHAGEEHEAEVEGNVDLDDLVPKTLGFYTWNGSLTTPPCTEGVTWVLFDTPQTLSSQQLTLLQSKMGAVRANCQEEAKAAGDLEAMAACSNMGDLKTNRELQPLNDRRVSHVSAALPS